MEFACRFIQIDRILLTIYREDGPDEIASISIRLRSMLCIVALSAAQNLTNEFVIGCFKGPYLNLGTGGTGPNHDENIRRVQEFKNANFNFYAASRDLVGYPNV
jgi:hypothetical protein